MPIRLIAADLDGTLLRSDGSISARTRAALANAEARGRVVMSVTARPPRRVQRIAAASGLRGLAICSNGAVLYDLETQRVVRQHRLAAEVVAELVARLRTSLPDVAFAIEAGAEYGCEPSYRILSEHPHDRVDPNMQRGDALELSRNGVTKLIVQRIGGALEELLAVTRAHAGALATVTHSGSEFVEVAAAGVTKALALEAYCEERGIRCQDVVAFGDMPNDIPMLSWAGRAVAVANAHPEVLAVAAEVTRSNDEDGVADTLEALAACDYLA
ncbi:MAG TPA: Cof-type HAD-IIB family hydrolase [Polyangiales bacterium]|nr:Cof-type HAD-IIB family hydrolase [Polyangiales bacterium]